jgi:drug/metabolite transporter (DMT)-like permease
LSTIEPHLIGLVLIAAFTHASWNALVKTTGDGLCTFATVMGTGAVIYMFVAPFVTLPEREVWGYLAVSTLLHYGYFIFLWYALRHGDLSTAYPVARGSAPIIVGVGATVLAGEVLSTQSTIGLAVASSGICMLALEKGLPKQGHRKPFVLAFITGLFIASYTVVDGLGLTIASEPWGYIVWLNILDGAPLLLYVLLTRRQLYIEFLRIDGKKAVLGGVLAMIGYFFVLYALSFGHMAHVSALRETSVLIAVILGCFTLHEKFGPIRWVAAIAIVCGVASMHLSG